MSIYIEANSEIIQVAGCHENYCVLREPLKTEPFEGVLVIHVDGQEYRTLASFANSSAQGSNIIEFSEIRQKPVAKQPRGFLLNVLRKLGF